MNRCLTLLLVSLVLIAFAPPVHADTEIEPTIVVDYMVDPATPEPRRSPSQTAQQMRSGIIY